VSPIRTLYSTPFPDGLPGPYVTVRVTRGDGSGDFRDLQAVLDTGCEITLLPRLTVEALNLQFVTDDLELHDGTGQVTSNAEMYRADIQIRGLPLRTVGISPTKSPVAFIGLDVLNEYVATFDGPQQAVTVD
jgi:predicted aspartyl protease